MGAISLERSDQGSARCTTPNEWNMAFGSQEHSFKGLNEIHWVSVPPARRSPKMFPTQKRGYVERTVALLSQRDGVDKVRERGMQPVAASEPGHVRTGETPEPNPQD